MPEFKNLVDKLTALSQKRGDAPALIFRDKFHERYVLDWKRIYALSGRFAAVLSGLGVDRGQLVVNTLVSSPERALSEFGCMMAGAVTVGGYSLLADASDLLHRLRVSRASIILVDPDFPDSPWNVLRNSITVKDDDDNYVNVTSQSLPDLQKVYFVRRLRNGAKGDFISDLESLQDWFRAENTTEGDFVNVYTTSGSTGFSKLVAYTHGRFADHAPAVDPNQPLDIQFNLATLDGIAGTLALLVVFGSTRVLCDFRAGIPEDMAGFAWRCLEEENCSTASFSPVLLPRLVSLAQSSKSLTTTPNGSPGVITETGAVAATTTSLGSLRLRPLNSIFLSGMPVTRAMVLDRLLLADRLYMRYSVTELGAITWQLLQQGEGQDFQDYDTGLVMKGVEVKVVSVEDEDTEVPTGQPGLLLCKNRHIHDVYFNDTQLSAASVTKDGFFRTGDIGWMDGRGHLFVEGRSGDAIIRGNFIFYPAWLEARISACPGVLHVLVVGVPDQHHKEELCACLVLAEDVGVDDVRGFVTRDIVAGEKAHTSARPRYYLAFQSFSLTSTGKVIRGLVKSQAAERLGLVQEHQ